jgi:hypothetical protein
LRLGPLLGQPAVRTRLVAVIDGVRAEARLDEPWARSR